LTPAGVLDILLTLYVPGGSSSGRTTGSEPVYGGSNPPPPTNNFSLSYEFLVLSLLDPATAFQRYLSFN
jgi:hypothetical protein